MTFEEFERDWLRKHRALVPRKAKVSSASEVFWIFFWVVVSMGAAVFSAAHTIPAAEMTILVTVPGRSYLALTAFVIVEFVIFGAAAGRHEIGWLTWLLAGAVSVALVGNISSSVHAVTENGGNGLNQIGGILLSVIAPITALAAGEVLHRQQAKLSARRTAAQDDYDQRMVELQAKINTAWTRYEKDATKADGRADAGAGQVSAVRPPDADTDERQHGFGQGYTKRTDARTRVLDYLQQNADAVDMTVRELAERTGVGKSVAAEVLREFKQRPSAQQPVAHALPASVVSSNGKHSEVTE